jgi:hypothetical protein
MELENQTLCAFLTGIRSTTIYQWRDRRSIDRQSSKFCLCIAGKFLVIVGAAGSAARTEPLRCHEVAVGSLSTDWR